jgi:hypothetical protein
MTLGTILGASFRVVRRNPRPVVGISLVIHVIIGVISVGVTLLFTLGALGNYFDFISAASTGDVSESSALGAVSSLLVVLGAQLLTLIITYGGETILQGIITMEVSRGTLGEKLPLAALWTRTRGRIAPLFGWAGLTIVAAIVGITVPLGIAVVLIALGGAALVFGIILIIVVPLGIGVLAVWLVTKLSFVPSALIIERLPLFGRSGAIARSWSLVRGFFWRTFGIQLLVAVMVGVAAEFVQFPVTIIVEIATSVGNPVGLSNSGAAIGAVFGATQIATTITTAIVTTITAIITTAVTSLLYIDLRIRKEGLDFALTQYTDARAAGGTALPDPYLTASSRPAAVPKPATPTA